MAYPIIDFDEVKTEYQRGKSGNPKSSVDGFTYKNQLCCFVELKGWADFLAFHTNLDTLQTEIKEQADKYNLNKKLMDSMSICREVSENENIFKDTLEKTSPEFIRLGKEYLIKEKIPAIMSGHLAFPQILKTGEPASLSKFFLQDLPFELVVVYEYEKGEERI